MSEREMKQAKFGFLYEPSSEGEVCLLFGFLMPHIGEELERLGFPASECYVEEWTEQPTDVVLRTDGSKLRVEFELYSSNFRGQHDPEKCELIVCWKNNWHGHSIKVLELSRIVREKRPDAILNNEPKYKRRKEPWSLDEFMTQLRQNLLDDDFQEMSAFIEELKATKCVELILGKGDKIPTLGVCTKLGEGLSIEASGKAYIAYSNVNVKPPKPNLPEEKIVEIRKLLNEPKLEWHYIKAENLKDRISKLRQIVKIMVSQ